MDGPEFWTALLLCAVSPAVGSFLRLAADRADATVFGRSRCDACGAPLAWADLVPLLSWIWAWTARGGRARCCGATISARHPIAEATALGLTIWAAAVMSDPVLLSLTALLGWTLLWISLVDFDRYELPDVGTLGLVLAGLALSLAGMTGPLMSHALGAAVGFGAFWLLGELYYRWRGVDGLGVGDAKLLGAAGAWLGAAALPSVALIGCLAGLTLTLGLARFRGERLHGKIQIPFGPALALGFWVVWLYGPLAFVAS